MQSTLNGKADASHTHTISQINNLQDALDKKFDKTGGTITGYTDIKVNTPSNGDFIPLFSVSTSTNGNGFAWYTQNDGDSVGQSYIVFADRYPIYLKMWNNDEYNYQKIYLPSTNGLQDRTFATEDVVEAHYLQKSGGSLTGDLALYAASGNSPRLIFQRGTLTDNLNDWSLYDSGGYLYVQQRGSGSSAWETRAQFTQSGVNFTGTISEDGTLLSSKYVAGPSSSTANAVPRYDGTTGKIIKDSGVTISDAGYLYATKFNVAGKAAVQYNSTEDCIEFIFA